LESMQDLWKNECQKEELKSVEIWKHKQSWLERYEEEYDSRNIFRKEENQCMLFRFDEPRSAVSYVSGWPNIYFSTSILGYFAACNFYFAITTVNY
jgi:UDP-N-acetylmuramyl pentapeptide synthase